MHRFRGVFLLVLAWAGLLTLVGQGPLVRQPNTTLRMPVVPGAFGYEFIPAFDLSFEAPVVIAAPPGETNRLFIVEQRGRILVITNLAVPTTTVFLNVVGSTVYGGEQGLLGLAFHPDYARNGRFFVFRTTMARTGSQTANRLHNRLSEYRVSPTNPNQASPTERILFQQSDDAGNHNGGDLHFGLDGYLYVAVGDEGNANDSLNNSQTLTKDLFAGILRLDVDQRPGSLEPNPHPAVVAGSYRIPADNPYVGATNFLGRAVNPALVRTEYWSVGLRNPWRMSFDRATGELWVGDVGQDVWESVFISRSGANHGWAFREGNAAGPKSGAPADFQTNPIHRHVRPVFVYGHGSGPTRGNSITGGVVYRGSRLGQLHGYYVFADYVSGNVWSLLRRETAAPLVTRLTGQTGISAFGVDPQNGDILACAHQSGRILRLTYNEVFTGEPLPPTLADTGAFADLRTFTPNPGVVPYEVNLSFWSDSATKHRWFCVPQTNQFLTYTTNGAFGAPAGTVWVKHFDILMNEAVPESRRRLETRFLVRQPNGVYGVTYRWDSESNATLVPEEGLDEQLTRTVGGVTVTQNWRYPSRAECLSCHTPQAGHSLSFNGAQLHSPNDAPGDPQRLAALVAAGYFSPAPGNLQPLKTAVPPGENGASLEWRARSWLAVNCSSCHRAGGTGGGFFDLRLTTPTELTGIINGMLSDNWGNETNRVVVPGDLDHSVLWQRMKLRGSGQMPPLATELVDPQGVELVRQWIEQLAQTPPDVAPSVVAETAGEKLRLRVVQPANQAVTLESASNLTGSEWRPVEVPGLAPVFPSTLRELIWDLTPDRTQYYRVRGTGP
ncbi:MAG: PQQ-dependent sugar dehydrogenase [Verrucomicrobia bacterium]|nr:PQQ-dependent sugar dehydrogenase [Verrucomicrobiota bacterium]